MLSRDVLRLKSKKPTGSLRLNIILIKIMEKYELLYSSVNKLMATIGAEGEVISRHPDVMAVMDALSVLEGEN